MHFSFLRDNICFLFRFVCNTWYYHLTILYLGFQQQEKTQEQWGEMIFLNIHPNAASSAINSRRQITFWFRDNGGSGRNADEQTEWRRRGRRTCPSNMQLWHFIITRWGYCLIRALASVILLQHPINVSFYSLLVELLLIDSKWLFDFWKHCQTLSLCTHLLSHIHSWSVLRCSGAYKKKTFQFKKQLDQRRKQRIRHAIKSKTAHFYLLRMILPCPFFLFLVYLCLAFDSAALQEQSYCSSPFKTWATKPSFNSEVQFLVFGQVHRKQAGYVKIMNALDFYLSLPALLNRNTILERS